jgi:ribosomal protein S18 acetylase RimI-like enzyme
MSVLILGRDTDYEQGPRPLDVLRDLDGMARLLDIAFGEDMASEGSPLRRDLAILAMASPAVWVLRRLSAEFRDAFDGFVWSEGGQIVGNVTLTRDDPARPIWTISNVAVHPDYRRRGIARGLMQVSLDAVRERGGGYVALEVKAGNSAAYGLYRGLGFRFVEGTVTLRGGNAGGAGARLSEQVDSGGAEARPMKPHEWPKLYALMADTRSADAQKLSPLRSADYAQTLLRRLASTVVDVMEQTHRLWLVVDDGDRFVAAARIEQRVGGARSIRLTIHPDGRDRAGQLVRASLDGSEGSGQRTTVYVGSQQEEALDILRQLGFHEVRNLHRLMIDISGQV